MEKINSTKFLKLGINIAKILAAHYCDKEVYLKVAEYLYCQLDDLIGQVRIYIIDEKEENFKEEVIYSGDGMKPGYDFIPFYQLPDRIKDKKITKYRNAEDLFLLVPLVIADNIIGLMELKIIRAINYNLIKEIEQMAEVIALGLNQNLFNYRNFQSLLLTDIVIEINNCIQSITNLDDMISTFLKLTIKKFNFDRVTIFLFGQNNEIENAKGITENGDFYDLKEIPPLPDPGKSYKYMENLPGYLYSLNTNTKRVGMVLFDNIYSLYEITAHLVDVLRIICSQFASAVDNISMFNDLQRAAFNDKLTGLYNRRYFHNTIVKYEKEEYLPVSVIIGDVNGLKITNDVFGHHAGDKLLIKISDILQQCSREDDIVFRWGGDEFFILLPETTEKQVQEVCKQIKSACEQYSGTKVKLSISLGTSTRKSKDEKFKDILAKAEDRMYRHKLMETRSFRSSLISSLKETLSEKCRESAEHTNKVAELSIKIAEEMGISESSFDNLKLAAMLHDIGKVAVDNNILNKAGSLTKEEWDIIKRHPETGYRIAQSSFELSSIAEFILYHHERWDGEGYPVGKTGRKIPLISRIIAVVDAYTVMIQGSSYKKAVSHQMALAELKRCSGSQFDPKIVEIFLGLEFE